MSWDLLLHWMTHLGEGSWSQFRRAVSELASGNDDPQRLCQDLRPWLSDVAHADFFLDGTPRWATLSPMLCGLSCRPNAYLFSGGRTPTLTDALERSAVRNGCTMSVEAGRVHPDVVVMEGSGQDIERCTAECGLDLLPDAGEALAGTLVPIPVLVDQAREAAAPVNWSVRSFDLATMQWVEGMMRGAALEYSPRHGSRRYLLSRRRRGGLLEMPKRESIYASAMLRRVELIRYDPANRILSTPAAAPLPARYARAAALCAGTTPRTIDGRLVYAEVPMQTAALLLVAAGQSHPMSRGCCHPQEAVYEQSI